MNARNRRSSLGLVAPSQREIGQAIWRPQRALDRLDAALADFLEEVKLAA